MNPFTNPGGIKSVPDYRDQIYASTANPIPQSVTLPFSLQTNFQKFGIFDQQQTPACVSHAWAKLMQLYWYTKTGKLINFSPRFLHIQSAFKGAGPDDGRDPRTVAQISQSMGCATESTLPNNTSLSNVEYFDPSVITAEVLADAAQYKIPSFISIDTNQQAIRTAIQKFGGVSMLWEVGNTMWTDLDGNVTWAQSAIDPLRAPTTITSGHEVIASGWNQSDLDHMVNSWSEGWCQGGEADFIWNEWSDFVNEAWVISDANPEALAIVQELPSANEFKHTFSTVIRQGDSGPEVRALQIALAIDGDFSYPEITGNYGSITAAAVLAFQNKYQIASSSVLIPLAGSQVGPLTQKKLTQLYG